MILPGLFKSASVWLIARSVAATLVLSGCTTVPASGSPEPLVTVAQGTLRGRHDGDIAFFGNIPYAAPPVGALRWKAPQPVQAWGTRRDAQDFGPICHQAQRGPAEPQAPPMSEDCLTLNVWTPQAARGRAPVMVWIHGGGFNFGSGREPGYDGAALARKGVVLVTVNYRVGALGFMAHPGLTAEAPYRASGNYGILDQIAALQWVQRNIAAFGGDPGNVTIFGESAGAGSVNILQASPLAAGLFHKVIGQSTSQFDPDGGLLGRKDMRQAEEYGREFSQSLGASTVAELRTLSAEKINSDFRFFWPTERDGHVLPDLVYNIFAQGRQNDVPTIVGSNSDEGATIPMDWVKRDEAGPAAFDRIYSRFPNPLRQSATDAVQWQMRVWAKLQAQSGTQKSWLYWFDRAWPGREQDGAFHGAEIIYAFGTLDTQNQPWTDEDRRLSALMSNYWVSFARDGNPNGEGLPHWPSYEEADPKLMLLAPEPRIITTPRAEAQQFLDAYFDARR